MNNKQREFPVKKFFGYSAMYFRGEKKSCICFFTVFNGISKYSNLTEVRIKADKNFIIYSNRFNEKNMFINYSDELKGKEVLVVLADILGNQAYSKVIITETNRTNVTAFDPSQKIPTGVYFIIASSNNSICKQKIIIE